jgi:hypothetical protein
MGLAFDSNLSTASRNKSVKLYSEKPGNSPLDRDVFQVDICHGGWCLYGSRRKGKVVGSRAAANYPSCQAPA